MIADRSARQRGCGPDRGGSRCRGSAHLQRLPDRQPPAGAGPRGRWPAHADRRRLDGTRTTHPRCPRVLIPRPSAAGCCGGSSRSGLSWRRCWYLAVDRPGAGRAAVERPARPVAVPEPGLTSRPSAAEPYEVAPDVEIAGPRHRHARPRRPGAVAGLLAPRRRPRGASAPGRRPAPAGRPADPLLLECRRPARRGHPRRPITGDSGACRRSVPRREPPTRGTRPGAHDGWGCWASRHRRHRLPQVHPRPGRGAELPRTVSGRLVADHCEDWRDRLRLERCCRRPAPLRPVSHGTPTGPGPLPSMMTRTSAE